MLYGKFSLRCVACVSMFIVAHRVYAPLLNNAVLWQALQPLRDEQPDADSSSTNSSSSSSSSVVQALKRGAALTTAVAAFTTAAAAKLCLPVVVVQLSYRQGIELLTPGNSNTALPLQCVQA
jgi:hypothetical protein